MPNPPALWISYTDSVQILLDIKAGCFLPGFRSTQSFFMFFVILYMKVNKAHAYRPDLSNLRVIFDAFQKLAAYLVIKRLLL